MSPVVPVPGGCVACGSGSGGLGSLLVCDMVDGEVVGSALAVYTYDPDTGAPVGPPTYVDPATGDPYTPVGILQPCPTDPIPEPDTLTAQARLLTAGQSWTPGTDVVGTLTAVSFSTITGTTTLTDANGTVSAALPPGLSGSWSVADADTLTGPQSIAAVGGNTWVTWTQR